MKFFIALALVTITPLSGLAAQNDWLNECPGVSEVYCPNVGKTAHNSFNNPPILRGIRLGAIVGVSFRTKGSAIAYVPGFPEAGIPERAIEATGDDHYYIIDDGRGKLFLRKCRDVDAK